MLRITEGEHRGRKIKVPAVDATRPLGERARIGMFNHLRGLLAGAVVWDVYAGSGILGLEALSRGAAMVVAVELNARAAAQLEINARQLGVQARILILRVDAHRFVAKLEQWEERPAAADLLFFDPPYAAFEAGGTGRRAVWDLFCELAARLRPAGAAVVHTPRGILSGEESARLPGIERRDYGSTSLYWWHKPE